MTSKATPSRRKRRRCRCRRSSEEPEKCFHLEDKDQAGSIPTKRRATTPKDAGDVDTDTIAEKAFARRFVNVDPITKEKMNHNTDRDHQKLEG
jgi:hypothetical protein